MLFLFYISICYFMDNRTKFRWKIKMQILTILSHNVNEEYPFQLYPFGEYFKLKAEYKGWEIGNQYGI